MPRSILAATSFDVRLRVCYVGGETVQAGVRRRTVVGRGFVTRSECGRATANVYVVERGGLVGAVVARYIPLGIQVEAHDDLELESKVSNAIGCAEHLLTNLKIRPGAFRDARAHRRAVERLADNSLNDHDAATRFLNEHPEPNLP